MDNNITTPKPKKKILPFILGGVLLVGAYFAFNKINYALHNEDTENSQLEANISPVASRSSGYVTEIKVAENQLVKKGDTLLKIDDRDLVLRVKQAEIALKNATVNVGIVTANVSTANAGVGTSRANFETANAGIETANANIEIGNATFESAKIRVWKAGQEFARTNNLLEAKAATLQQFDNARAEKESADAQLVVAQKQIEVAKRQAEVAKKQAMGGKKQEEATQIQAGATGKQTELARVQVEQRQADLDFARLQLSYATITAPCDGTVTKKNVQLGQFINVGQSLMAVVDEKNIWVIANFKETQITEMKVGQAVKIKVDAFPEKNFDGKIESFSPATGAKFALLPPDNASGNFVKVVQRIPVKIVLTDQSEESKQLRVGMNVKVVVPNK